MWFLLFKILRTKKKNLANDQNYEKNNNIFIEKNIYTKIVTR